MKTLKGVVDRFEGHLAVVYIGDKPDPVDLRRSLLPYDVKEGDHLLLETDGDQVISIQIDPDSTEATRKRIQEKMDRLRRGEHLRKD